MATNLEKFAQLGALLVATGKVKEVSYLPPQSASFLPAVGNSAGDTAAVQAIIDGFDWSDAASTTRTTTTARTDAISDYANGPDGLKVVIRALALVILDEINILRSAASLAPRSASQIKTAITNKINAGTADSQ